MSISTSLANAMSGLNASSRAAGVVSANISNALTDGYGRRELELSSRSLAGNGAGVKVDGVFRRVDAAVIEDLRLADASLNNLEPRSSFHTTINASIGLPDSANSLSAKFAELEASLIEAASRPDSETRLRAVAKNAGNVADHLNSVSNTIQNARMDADQQIGREVREINQGLQNVSDLNIQIQKALSSGRDATALMDQRQVQINNVAAIIPVREIPRENGQVSLYTPGGAILVDSKASRFEFQSVGVITHDMTIQSGALSGLTLNGQTVTANGTKSVIAGGSMGALFDVRDSLSTEVQTQLDAVARDLVERFSDPTVDPTLTPTDPGLFTDNGGAFDPLNESGLSSRVSLNSLVDPGGGEIWRLRAGLNATGPGDVGDATLLTSLADALSNQRAPASGQFAGIQHSASGLTIELLSANNAELQGLDIQVGFSQAQYDALKSQELENGVDTDNELQNLMLIEQSFAANARVITTIDEMIQTLMRI